MSNEIMVPQLVVPRPDVNGEFATPAEGAKFMASFGIPQTPLNGKTPILPEWENKGTIDFAEIDALYEKHRCNFGSIAKAVVSGHLVWEVDSLDVRKRFQEDTGRYITNTLTIGSMKGGHRWFVQTPESIATGNIAQGFVKHGDFSLRVNNQQAVSPGSVHPVSLKQYKVLVNTPPVAILSEEVTWLAAQRIEKEKVIADDNQSPILENSRNNTLCHIAGRLRATGLDYDQMEPVLLDINEKRCTPPLPSDEVKTICQSVCRYKQGDPASGMLLIGGKLVGAPTNEPDVPVTVKLPNGRTVVTIKGASYTLDTRGIGARPKFPEWTIAGTSIGEGLVKPTLAMSNKHAQFIFMSSVQVMLNWMFGKVRIHEQDVKLNLFLGFISPHGQFFKSSSAELSYEYFKYAGILQRHENQLRNAEGQIITLTAGSSEGFGLELARLRATKAILVNDELGAFCSKANIENSSFTHHLLQWYESNAFGNNVSNAKKSFSFSPGEYCFSWLFCTTDSGFNRYWPKIAGIASGSVDRMFFVVSPKEPKIVTTFHNPFFHQQALETRKLLDRAVEQAVFKFDDIQSAQQQLNSLNLDPRSLQLVQKLALYFAVDLGETAISMDALERAIALVKYRNDTIEFLAPIEAENTFARIEMEIEREVRQNGGIVTYRKLCRGVQYERYSMRDWDTCYNGLLRHKRLVEWYEPSKRGSPSHKVGLVSQDDDLELE